ncbi:Replication factor C small subunit [uncultured archaeon]|nr:Replication factor C small subunit [uncultured archaeon]
MDQLTNSLWTEKHRPKTIDEYIFADENQKASVSKWIQQKDVPNLLLYGPPGVGKSCLAALLVSEIGIDPMDFLEINASRENSVDDMRSKILNFVETAPWGSKRIVLLQEADNLTIQAQGMMRDPLEKFSSTSRFILTCNYPNKIIPAIHSRVQTLEIFRLPKEEFTLKMAEILAAENVSFDLDTLDSYVQGSYPDLRKCINSCQQNSIDGQLLKPLSKDSSADWKIESVELFKQGKIREGRELIASQIRMEELDEFFRFLYDHLDFWGKTNQQKDKAILKIRDGLVQIPLVACAEILCSSVLIELEQIVQGE